MSQITSRACDGRDSGKTSIYPRQQAAVIPAILMRIHSILSVCSRFILSYFPALLRMIATLQLGPMLYSLKRTSLLRSAILKPEGALQYLREHFNELAARARDITISSMPQGATGRGVEGVAAAAPERPEPQVSALRLFDLFCVDLATGLVQSIRMLPSRISANEDHQLWRRDGPPTALRMHLYTSKQDLVSTNRNETTTEKDKSQSAPVYHRPCRRTG
jgi:hypothetical protein